MNATQGFSGITRLTRLAAAAMVLVPGLALAAPGIATVKVTAPASAAAYLPPPALPQPAAGSQPVVAEAARLESLGMGDMVRITVFRNPDLTTEARVSERGTILFPLIGEVTVSGLTTQQVGATIADKLKAGKYVVNPEVTVSIAQVNSRQVSVLGNVTRPGRYPLDSVNVKLTDVLALAGGVAAPASDMVTIVSTKDGKTAKTDIDLAAMFRNGDLTGNLELAPGDTVYVHKAPMVYVHGEVHRGGAYRVEPNMTVMQAIALGGGITPRGSERRIKLSRRTDTGVERVDARLTDPVKPDDVILVRESIF